jgi:Sigma-70 factor, region 1.1
MNSSLEHLIRLGQQQGYITYVQVNACLSDEPSDPERLDRLLMLLEDHGIELIDEEEAAERVGEKPKVSEPRGIAPFQELLFFQPSARHYHRRIGRPGRTAACRMEKSGQL